MSLPDMINGGFEAAAGLAVLAHCAQLHEDKQVRGLSVPAVLFFAAWGLWNLFYYPHLGQVWSFAGGIFVTLANLAYVAMLIAYSRHAMARRVRYHLVCGFVGHRYDARSFNLHTLYHCRRCGEEIAQRRFADLEPMSDEDLEEWHRDADLERESAS